MVRHLPVERKLHRSWALDQQLAGAHHKRRVGIADTCRELPEGTCIARVGVRPEQHL